MAQLMRGRGVARWWHPMAPVARGGWGPRDGAIRWRGWRGVGRGRNGGTRWRRWRGGAWGPRDDVIRWRLSRRMGWLARVYPPRVEGRFGEVAADVGRAYARRSIEVAASALAGVRGPCAGVRSLLLVLTTGGGRSRWRACCKSMHLIIFNDFTILQRIMRCATCGASNSHRLSLAMAICSGGYSRNHNTRPCPCQYPPHLALCAPAGTIQP